MKLNALIAAAEPKTAILYVVYKEHTLGCLFKERNGSLWLEVFHGSVLKGGINWLHGPHLLFPQDLQHLRQASLADFEEYRVSPKGYDPALMAPRE
ncbi:MAG: hypothetical protein JNK31_06515 [Candidatus Competibacter sp.]|nr:hypothetical protein [Candidatus Competibacter sp.]